jgi:hypothetical protein
MDSLPVITRRLDLSEHEVRHVCTGDRTAFQILNRAYDAIIATASAVRQATGTHE